MATIPQDDSEFTVELTDDDLLEYLMGNFNMSKEQAITSMNGRRDSDESSYHGVFEGQPGAKPNYFIGRQWLNHFPKL